MFFPSHHYFFVFDDFFQIFRMHVRVSRALYILLSSCRTLIGRYTGIERWNELYLQTFAKKTKKIEKNRNCEAKEMEFAAAAHDLPTFGDVSRWYSCMQPITFCMRPLLRKRQREIERERAGPAVFQLHTKYQAYDLKTVHTAFADDGLKHKLFPL